jgi:acetyl esterase
MSGTGASTPSGWLERLDPDARALVAGSQRASRPSFDELSIEELRALMPAAALPPDLHDVHDETIALPGRELTVRVYRPSAESGLPIVVFLHGGGWIMGHLDGYDGLCGELAKAVGAVVVSVGYRLAPEHVFPAPLEDSYAGLCWVAAHAAQLGGDVARLAVAGDSAGGNLATVCAAMARDLGGPALACQLLIYPGIDPASTRPAMADSDGALLSAAASRWMWRTYVRDESHLRSPFVAPMLAELAGLPPAIIVTAEVDVNRDDGAAYALRLAEEGVAVDYLHYPGTYHGFVMHTGAIAKARTAMNDIVARLGERLAADPKGTR